MFTPRALVLLPVVLGLALAGAVWGVEEFALLAVAAATLWVLGAVVLFWQVVPARRRLLVEIRRPSGEVAVGAASEVALVVSSRSVRRTVPLWVGGPRWSVSHPGVAGRVDTWRRPPGAPPTRGVPPRSKLLTRLANALVARSPFALVAPVAAEHPQSVALTVPTDRRGLWSLEPLRLSCRDPFGLWCWPVVLAPPMHVVVLPRPSHDGQVASEERPTALRSELPATAPLTGGRSGDEFAGLRPYEPGDHLNRLHWPALARTGDLMVRHFVEPEAKRAVLFVDLRGWRRNPRMVDDAVASAAGAGLEALERGSVLEVETSSGEHFAVSPGPAARTRLLTALALVGP